MDRGYVARIAEAEGLGEWATAIAREALPSLRIHLSEESDPKYSVSRLGGEPVLPTDYPWPRWRGRPQSFIGQVRLTDLGKLTQGQGLPSDGLLAFFYDSSQVVWGFDPADEGGSTVVWFPDDADLQVRRAPPELGEDGALFRPRAIGFVAEWTLPDWHSPEMDDLGIPEVNRVGGKAVVDRYHQLCERLCGDEHTPRHRLFGAPDQIQDDMRLECELVTNGINYGDPREAERPKVSELEPNAKQWRLLLQVDSDDDLGTMWADSGRIYYWIRQDALDARSFDRTWLILQCY